MAYGDSVKWNLHNLRMNELWEKIKEARTGAGLTQADVAEACGTTRNAISLWESDDHEKRTTPTFERLKILSKMTGRKLSWFLDEGNPEEGRKIESIKLKLEGEDQIRDFARRMPEAAMVPMLKQFLAQVSDDDLRAILPDFADRIAKLVAKDK